MNAVLSRTNVLLPIRKCVAWTYSRSTSAVNNYTICTFQTCILTKPENVSRQQIRHAVSGFFNKHSASEIWKSVSSVSSAGRRRGRGKSRGKKIVKDLNKGQVIGIGKENIRFPGLSSPIIRGRELVQQQKLPPDEKYEENLIQLRQAAVARTKRKKVAPIDRGWSGGHAAGCKIGPPDPVNDNKFEGFETIIFEQKAAFHMTSHFGRYRTVFAICGTGNGNGLFGYSMATAPEARPALRRAKNRAAQRLMYIPRYENRTVFHNFSSRFLNTRVFVWKQAPGYGLCCHRLIKSICELVGIKDLYVKVEGGRSILNVLHAFLLGLLRQKTYEELADETKMHVVEMNQQNDYFPKVLASPNMPLESTDEPLDFDLYCFDNNVYARKPKREPFFTKDKRWPIQLRVKEFKRGLPEARRQLITEYGEVRSFLTDNFEECKPFLPPWSKVIKERYRAKKEKDELEGTN